MVVRKTAVPRAHSAKGRERGSRTIAPYRLGATRLLQILQQQSLGFGHRLCV